MKIVFYYKLNPFWLENIENLRAEFGEVDFVTNREKIQEEMEGAQGIVAGELSLEVVRRARNLEIIFVPYAGVDALPLDYARDRKIRICNVHGNAHYVAERCIAMVLAFYGRIIDYHDDLKHSLWHGYWGGGGIKDTWESIRGKSCAIIGAGEIGKCIARYLKLFDCKVIGFRKRPIRESAEDFDEITLDLNTALDKAELVFVALPLTQETRGLLSANLLARMHGKFLVNVGRGGVVDEEGLYRALKNGTLKGAAIDVWYTYPGMGKPFGRPSGFPFEMLPNVILSPHLAGFTQQAAILNIQQTIENIRAYLRTGKALSEVDLSLMY